MSLCHIIAILCLTVSAVQSQDNCLGPGFTQTIPAQQEWSQYSTTVLKPGDAAVYSSLSFACNGTLQSPTILSVARGSVDRYWNQYLYIVFSVWRFNETGYYQVREFQDRVKVTEQAVLQVSQFGAIPNTVSIFPHMDVLAKDTLAFRLLLPRGPVLWHVPFLFKPGPSSGAFIPIVSANFTASIGPVTDDEGSTLSSTNGTNSEDNFSQNVEGSTLSSANGTDSEDNFSQSVIFGIFLAVCQVEVVVVAIATGLIVHFVTKGCIKQNPFLSHDRSGNTAELDSVRPDSQPSYEPVGLDGSIDEHMHVEMQPSPAYQEISMPEYM